MLMSQRFCPADSLYVTLLMNCISVLVSARVFQWYGLIAEMTFHGTNHRASKKNLRGSIIRSNPERSV